MTTTTTIHCFEEAGLGKAPFRYRGIEDQDIRYGQRVIGEIGGCTIETKPGGTCAYCGTYIIDMYNVESADGKRFHVGCECIKKTGDEGLIRRMSEDKRKLDKKKRDDRKARKLAEAKAYALATLPKIRGTLASLPHPSSYMRDKTALDYANWLASQSHFEMLATYCRRFEAVPSAINFPEESSHV